MGMSYRRYLSGARIYGCSTCRTHLATIHSMISRAFNGQHGRAYLFDGVVNVVEGEPSDRQMTTGNHTVRDIYCCKCGTTLGWKYVRAPARMLTRSDRLTAPAGPSVRDLAEVQRGQVHPRAQPARGRAVTAAPRAAPRAPSAARRASAPPRDGHADGCWSHRSWSCSPPSSCLGHLGHPRPPVAQPHTAHARVCEARPEVAWEEAPAVCGGLRSVDGPHPSAAASLSVHIVPPNRTRSVPPPRHRPPFPYVHHPSIFRVAHHLI
ncbi:hypothetical protein A0H81_00536 [Grifola frondosa]|uniref:Yippee domain-containing protein n=1 Tax=Grifola frondosa TaxID=5627 RepID=A0A1C7MQ85_GRIFR|nr:hypothetical protein A0H81_00536 [Grifola frondosa]